MQSKELQDRIKKTEKDLLDANKILADNMKVMLTKNAQRGDCWRNSGLLGQFLEIHSSYFRLRNLIWNQNPYNMNGEELAAWEAQIKNAFEDLRNFTLLGELCLREFNYKGNMYIKEELEKHGL